MKTQVDSLKLVLAFILVMNALWVAPVRTAVAQESDKPEAIRRSAGMISLPDPLVSAAGVKVTTARQWQDQRRAEVLELFREHVYGRSPGRPEGVKFTVVEEDPAALKGTATRREVDISFPGPRGTFTFRLVIYLPNPAKKPVPVFLLLNHRGNVSAQVNNPFFPVDQIIARGYAAAGITLGQLSPDKAGTYRDGVLGFLDGPEERSPDAWRTIAAWAWGGSRAMDYFETDKQIDSKRVAVAGHSRGGKTALWCGAEDERFALTISNNSGETGAALARRGVGQSLAIGNIRNPHWFATNFKRYNDKEDELPVDQHELIALLAPRLAYVASAETDAWADPLGEFLSCVHATPVYRLFGLKGMETDKQPPLDQPIHDGRIGYHIRKGGHGMTEYDWQRFMDFADRRLGKGIEAKPAPKNQRESEGTPKPDREVSWPDDRWPQDDPTNAGEAAAKKAAENRRIDELYQQKKATLSPERQRWESVLEENLGNGFYLPAHKRDFVKGISTAWDFVPDDPKLPRVLLIGDSVSRGYTLATRAALAGKANVHRAPANCGPTATGLEKLAVWLGAGKWDVIHFNFGIHDRATPLADYQSRLDQIITRLEATGAKLIWASTTPIPRDDAKKQDPESIVERNAVAARLALQHGVAINDLFAFITPQLATTQNRNDVHFNSGGYDLLGQQVARAIAAELRIANGPEAKPAPKDQREQEGTPKPDRKPATYSFPPVNSLPDLATMPDPFRKPDGTRVATKAEWPEQRAYLKALLEHYLYGTIPPRPAGKELSFERISDEAYSPPDSTIAGRKQSYRITITRGGKQHAFTFNLWRPAAERRYPTLINNQPEHSPAAKEFSMAEGLRRGYAVVEFRRGEVAPDQADNANRERGIFPLYPEYDFATIAAWGWAYQPVIDTLDRLGVVAMDKIIATGHSRGGQAAMAGAIFDERIAIAAPSTGGPFSVGSTRQRDPEGYRGKMDYAANFLKAQPHWFHPRYAEFAGKQNKQPWDATTLVALVAPRPLLNVNAVGDGINNGLAHEAGTRAAQVIYGWWGAEQFPRLHWRDVENKFGQKGHDQGPEEFLAIFDFADEFFFGKPRGPSTYNVAPKSDTWRYDPAKFPLLIGWKIPATR